MSTQANSRWWLHGCFLYILYFAVYMKKSIIYKCWNYKQKTAKFMLKEAKNGEYYRMEKKKIGRVFCVNSLFLSISYFYLYSA